MSELGVAGLQAARLLEANLAQWSDAILDVATNPSLESINRMNQSEMAYQFSLAAMGKAQEMMEAEGQALLSMMGIGSRFNGIG